MAFRPSKSYIVMSGTKCDNCKTVNMFPKLLIGIFRSFSSSLPTGVEYSILKTYQNQNKGRESHKNIIHDLRFCLQNSVQEEYINVNYAGIFT